MADLIRLVGKGVSDARWGGGTGNGYGEKIECPEDVADELAVEDE